MSSIPALPLAYGAAGRARQHTWLTVGGGALLVPLIVVGLLAYLGPETSAGGILVFFLQMSAAIFGIGILPALLFAFLREPVMRRLFDKVSRLTTQRGRATILLAGTLLVFVGYAAVATGLITLYMWLEGPAHRLSFWQYLTTQSDIVLIIVRTSLICAIPWLLAALASAWYVNRDLLPGSQFRN